MTNNLIINLSGAIKFGEPQNSGNSNLSRQPDELNLTIL